MSTTYKVNIWSHQEGKAFSMDVEDVQNEMEAAALTVSHYVTTIPDLDAVTTIDSSPVGIKPHPMHLRDVIGWLKKTPEGKAFVKQESLQALITRFTFD